MYASHFYLVVREKNSQFSVHLCMSHGAVLNVSTFDVCLGAIGYLNSGYYPFLLCCEWQWPTSVSTDVCTSSKASVEKRLETAATYQVSNLVVWCGKQRVWWWQYLGHRIVSAIGEWPQNVCHFVYCLKTLHVFALLVEKTHSLKIYSSILQSKLSIPLLISHSFSAGDLVAGILNVALFPM
jgi:hypothetical protein